MKKLLRFILKAVLALLCGALFTRFAFGFLAGNPAVASFAVPASIIIFLSITASTARIFDEIFPPSRSP